MWLIILIETLLDVLSNSSASASATTTTSSEFGIALSFPRSHMEIQEPYGKKKINPRLTFYSLLNQSLFQCRAYHIILKSVREVHTVVYTAKVTKNPSECVML